MENISSPNYYYYRKDHLGNNREVWLANTSATKQWTQYYPSGLPWVTTLNDNQSTQPYKYNGKEFVEMHGYDTYDYGARGYYPAIGRFTSLDPLAEKDYSISPYSYCGGNPVNRIDPNGMEYKYDWDNGVYRNGAGNIVPFSEIQANNFEEPKQVNDQNNLGADSRKALQGSEGNAIVGSKDNPQELGEPSVKAKMPERLKFGNIIGYVSLSANATLGGGLSGEIGYVYTDKGYAQYYISYGTTLGIGASATVNSGLIIALPSKEPQFADFVSTTINGGLSITPFLGGQASLNKNYVAVGATVGVGAKWNMKANGGQGNTILLGSPFNMKSDPGWCTKNYNPY